MAMTAGPGTGYNKSAFASLGAYADTTELERGEPWSCLECVRSFLCEAKHDVCVRARARAVCDVNVASDSQGQNRSLTGSIPVPVGISSNACPLASNDCLRAYI